MGFHPSFWIAALAGAERAGPAALVPGHDPVFRDLGYLRDVRAPLAEATKQAGSLLRQVLTWDEARARFQLDPLRCRFGGENDPTAAPFRDYSIG
jgi:hypothetical protein